MIETPCSANPETNVHRLIGSDQSVGRDLVREVFEIIAGNLVPKHYFAVLASIIGLAVLAPLVESSYWAGPVFGVLIMLNLLTASISITVSGRKRLLVLSLALLSGTMWVCSTCFSRVPFNSVPFELAASTVCLLFFIYACYMMLQDIMSGSITANRICGALCVYILIGFCFGIIHAMIALSDPLSYTESARYGARGAFHAVPMGQRFSPFVYFSFCTLSTLGYGDIAPLGRLARTCSWLEAVTGQFYMAVLVARLVGLHIAGASNKPEGLGS